MPRPADPAFAVRVTTQVSREEHAALTALAIAQGIGLSAVARWALKAYLDGARRPVPLPSRKASNQ